MESYFMAQISKCEKLPFIHPKLKNEANAPIPIEAYQQYDQDEEFYDYYTNDTWLENNNQIPSATFSIRTPSSEPPSTR